MVIDKNLLSKKSGQDSANELFGPLKTQLINARRELENIIANNQSKFIENIDSFVNEALHNNARIDNVADCITFNVRFARRIGGLIKNPNSIDFDTSVSNTEITYAFKSIYYHEIDKNLVNMSELSANELSQLRVDCEKYLANSINIDEIKINSKANTVKVYIDISDYLINATADFICFVVAYLAKRGIKSSARQVINRVTVVIERDTDTGGFEDI